MALKDLVADHRKITEETIEKIVAPFVRYDPAAKKIVWTPQGNTLGNEARVLVYLVAVLGWQYVLDEPETISSKPSDLEPELGIAGGTLRPLLKKLKEGRLITAAEGHYRAQIANIDAIEAAISGEATRTPSRGKRPSKTRRKISEGEDNAGSDTSIKKKGKRGNSGSLKTFLSEWIDEGYFAKAKTLPDLLERYHEHGVITKRTSLSGLMLHAVQDGLLARTKIDVGGKEIWAYSARTARRS